MIRVIHPDYLQLASFFDAFPEHFFTHGDVIYKSRNELKNFSVGSLVVTVKKYRKPNAINQFVYAYFRKSKAQRAYENALILLNKGIDTPFPVGYMAFFKHSLLTDSYFISLHSPYTRLFREFEHKVLDEADLEVVKAFARLMAHVHNNSILHLDLSVGNILFEQNKGECQFSLVDLNRMKFNKVGEKKGCKNFERLRGNAVFIHTLAHEYAKQRGFSAELCEKRIFKYIDKNARRFRRKIRLKNQLKKIGAIFFQ